MLKGVLMRVASAFAFAIMASLAKLTNGGYSVGQVVFFRSLFALAVLIVWLRARGDFPRAIYTRRPLGHLARGTGGTGGMFSYFLAVALLPLPDVVAIGYLAPLLVVALAAIVLGETVRFYRWTAVAIGFVGVLVMVSEHLGEGAGSRVGAMAAVSSAAFASYAVIQTRRLAQTETTGAIVFYFSVLTSFFGFLLMTLGFVWQETLPLGSFFAGQKWATPGFCDLALLVGVGLFGGVGQILMTDCVRYADASVIAPFEYTSIVFAMALGWWLFGEKPTPTILIGSVIVISAGLSVLWREHRLGRIARKPPI